MKIKYLLCFLFALAGYSSCITTGNMHSIEVEMMKPAIIDLPKDVDTIALFKRDLYQTEIITLKANEVEGIDTSAISPNEHKYLSNRCVDALANYLQQDGYFLKIINYSDSLNYLLAGMDSSFKYNALLKKLKVDAGIFLDYFNLESKELQYFNNYYYNFPEFQYSNQVKNITCGLYWTIAFKNDTLQYGCKQPDNLYYGDSVNPEFFGSRINHNRMLANTAVYLGHTFGTKLFPSLKKDSRSYYKSNNTNMLLAEKYLLSGQWINAAEIYNKETANKNRNIAAKAAFNMALVCEMEGHVDEAIDWMVNAYSAYDQKNPQHQDNCAKYVTTLAKRKKELERLEEQVR